MDNNASKLNSQKVPRRILGALLAGISAGVVPMEAEVRAWREAVGRMLNDLAPQAETVTRVFCGPPRRLKG